MLNKTISETGEEVSANDFKNAEVTSTGEEQKLREDAERQLVSFCGRILKEVSMLQPDPSEAVEADYHRALALRSPVTVQVLGYSHMSLSVFNAPSFSSQNFCVSTLSIPQAIIFCISRHS